jgi:hypothetical protein
MTATGQRAQSKISPGPRPVLESVAELFAGASHRERMPVAGPTIAPFERVVIEERPYVVKYLSWETDWLARASEDRQCRPLLMWRTGLLDLLPDRFDHAIVKVAYERTTGVTAVLMRDVADDLVPPGDVGLEPWHAGFVADMARLHARLWDWPDPLRLTPVRVRYTALGPATTARERDRGNPGGVPGMLAGCWAELLGLVPIAGALAIRLATDPTPLVTALATTPQAFTHGDWNASNLGRGADGRTILLDWQWPGRWAPLGELAWYLAVNAGRLPMSKEDTIALYRDALCREGVDVAGWWDTQLPLALLGAFVQLGWNKTGDHDELDWWADRALAAARLLNL